MKKLLAALIILGLLAVSPWAWYGYAEAAEGSFTITLEESKDHGPKLPSNAFVMPDKTAVWKLLSGIGTADYSDLVNIFAVMDVVKSKNLTIILHSPGGSVFDGMALAGLIQEKVKGGYQVEIRGYGIIASAATIVMVSGTKGKRVLDPRAFFMVHELSTFEFLTYKNVSEREKDVKVSRMIQTKIEKFVASMTGMELSAFQKLCKDETWLEPDKAVSLGFADEVLP